MDKIKNPHDRVVRETPSRKDTATDFLKNYLPGHILKLIDMGTLEISKDSFIEEDLTDFYSDILYKVDFKGSQGFLYLLFEHKSYEDAFIQFQLFGYIHKIYSLYLKQTKSKKLPIILPMVLYHGRKKWELSTRFSAVIDGPYETFKEYVPDFNYILFDLTQYSDEQIKGEIQLQVLLRLLKYVFSPDLHDKLSETLSLFAEIAEQDTGLQTIKVYLKYIFSTIEEKNTDKVKELIKKALSNEKGEFIMGTIAERYINEGIQQGIQQGVQQGMQQGIQLTLESIEMVLDIKFGANGLEYMKKIRKINDIQKLRELMKAIKTLQDLNELKRLMN
jgi:predicted transposase/invertase (TIGR01784 family)